MGLIESLKERISKVKFRLTDNSLDSVLWIINIVPTIAGFSLKKEKITVFTPFWIIHLFLLFYVYGVGSLVYQVYYAHSAGEFIKSYVNVSLLLLIANNSWWFLTQWSLLLSVIKEIKQNDNWAKESTEFRQKHEGMIGNIRKILLVLYLINYSSEFSLYLPTRANVNNEFSMTPCVGMQPLTSSPKREICSVLLGFHELTIASVVLNYQALLLFFIDHTAAMYHLLADEIMTFDKPDVDVAYVKEKLPKVLQRHVLTLGIIVKLKQLYSMPIGINFASNAVCISLFFYLPLQEWLTFIPVLIYCFLVFFLYCFLCQRLINAAEIFERAVYSCGWEKYDVQIQKAIYFMLIQAQVKVEILAADIIPVNIYTFATTIQFMFKFVTVMKF